MADFTEIFQFKTKRFWWTDILMYFAVSLLVATIFCYLIFLVKNQIQSAEIRKEIDALQEVGTNQQKKHEQEVIKYQGKVSDFSYLLKNHEFASNVFALMQSQTMPNVWFKQFGLDGKNSQVQLAGESDNLDALSRQIATFEKNKYVKSISSLNTAVGAGSRVDFSLNLGLDKEIFGYLADMASILNVVTSSSQPVLQPGEEAAGENPALSGENLVTIFHIITNPESVGQVNQDDHTIIVNVPMGTNLASLETDIVISPNATISPASGSTQDFTGPVTYIVTAENGEVQAYTVNVIPSMIPQTGVAQEKSGSKLIGLIIALVIILVVATIALIYIKKKKKVQ